MGHWTCKLQKSWKAAQDPADVAVCSSTLEANRLHQRLSHLGKKIDWLGDPAVDFFQRESCLICTLAIDPVNASQAARIPTLPLWMSLHCQGKCCTFISDRISLVYPACCVLACLPTDIVVLADVYMLPC